jgi:Spy/CpxP family protein refolding chaperone
MKKVAIVILAVTFGSFAFGQGPTPPSPGDQTQRQVKYLTTVLSLTTAQQQQAKTLYANSATSEQTIRASMRKAHETLSTAAKNNDAAGIDQASNTIGQLTAQLASIHAKNDAALYQILTPEQQTKLSDLQSQHGGPSALGGPGPGNGVQ